jgi:hypothetical protein
VSIPCLPCAPTCSAPLLTPLACHPLSFRPCHLPATLLYRPPRPLPLEPVTHPLRSAHLQPLPCHLLLPVLLPCLFCIAISGAQALLSLPPALAIFSLPCVISPTLLLAFLLPISTPAAGWQSCSAALQHCLAPPILRCCLLSAAVDAHHLR